MTAFTSFQTVLPDPNNGVASGGQVSSSAGDKGPGFASISITSGTPIQVSRTNSGRVISRSAAGHKYEIKIEYNPMTREQFEPVYSFLQQQNGRLNPFFIELPQQYTSRSSTFASYASSNTISNVGTLTQGSDFMVQAGHSTDQSKNPQIGDMFTITDTNDSLHKKAYRVTRVMVRDTYHSGLHSNPTTAQRIVYFNPPLQRKVEPTQTIDYTPKIRVILKNDIQSYSLGTNNLFSFSLDLEEAQA